MDSKSIKYNGLIKRSRRKQEMCITSKKLRMAKPIPMPGEHTKGTQKAHKMNIIHYSKLPQCGIW